MSLVKCSLLLQDFNHLTWEVLVPSGSQRLESKAELGPSLKSLMLRINYTRLFFLCHMLLIGMRMPPAILVYEVPRSVT